MKFLLAISRGIDGATTVLGRVAWWSSLVLVLIGVQNVVARYGYQWIRRVFSDEVAAALSNNTYLELQTLLYNIIFLLGAAYVFRVDAHVRVDILFTRYRARTRAWIDIWGTLLFLFPFAWMGIYFTETYVARSWSQLEISPNPGGLARYPIKTLIVVAFGLLIVQGLSQIIKHVAFLRGVKGSGSQYETEAATETVVHKAADAPSTLKAEADPAHRTRGSRPADVEPAHRTVGTRSAEVEPAHRPGGSRPAEAN